MSEDGNAKNQRPFDEEVQKLCSAVEGLSKSFPFISFVATGQRELALSKFHEYLEKHASKIVSEENAITYSLTQSAGNAALRMQQDAENAAIGQNLVLRSLLISLVSQFDCFVGRLVRHFLLTKPEVIAASEKKLPFSELLRFKSIDEAREYIIDQEVEAVLRKSHSDHFAWFEGKLNTTLRDLQAWPAFVELTERRNLFAHCDGIVSRQYLLVCGENKVPLEGITLGTQLEIDRKYFKSACTCVLEIGVKLAQVIWRKLIPAEIDWADRSLNKTSFELLVKGDYGLSQKILDFACSNSTKHRCEDTRRFLILNRAQAYKWGGKPDKCKEILDAEDWSACRDKLQIGVSVLNDDFKRASAIMKSLKRDEETNFEAAYQEWPIFKEFRKSPEFLEAFQNIYGRPFTVNITSLERKGPEGDSATGQKNSFD